jgi:hypothetical protein
MWTLELIGWCEKYDPSFASFSLLLKNDHAFVKTGSGQTHGKQTPNLKKTMAFSSSRRRNAAVVLRPVVRYLSTTPAAGAENAFFEPFIYKNKHFTKTGSGQT